MKNLLAVGMMIVTFGGVFGCSKSGPRRLPDAGFQVAFESHKVASEIPSGQTVSADITVKNVSKVTWPSKPDERGRYAVNLSYHWLDQKGSTVVFDGLRTPLPRDLKPGEAVDLKAQIQAPAKPGRYTLEVTLVQERAAWFPEKKGARLVLPVTVLEAGETTLGSAGAVPVPTPVAAGTPSEKTEKSLTEIVAKPNDSLRSVERDGGSWSVQVGSYVEKKIAMSLAKKLKSKDYDAYTTVAVIKGQELHRVRVGRFEQRAEAEKLRETLRTAEKLERAIVTRR